jgi:hypothetical protein
LPFIELVNLLLQIFGMSFGGFVGSIERGFGF